jgi:hypothetical protein
LRTDPEFDPITHVNGTATTPTGKTFPVRMPLGDGWWVWTGHPLGRSVGFQYLRAGILIRDPDEEGLRKAGDVAAALGARVIVDDWSQPL